MSLGSLQSKRKSCQCTGKLYQRIVQSQYDRAHVLQPLLVDECDQTLFVYLFLEREGLQVGVIGIGGILIVRALFARFHQLDGKGDTQYTCQPVELKDAKPLGSYVLLSVFFQHGIMPLLLIRISGARFRGLSRPFRLKPIGRKRCFRLFRFVGSEETLGESFLSDSYHFLWF